MRKLRDRARNKLTEGQVKLLLAHGYKGLSEEKLRAFNRAHNRYLAAAKFRANEGNGSCHLSLGEAERRVDEYLKSL